VESTNGFFSDRAIGVVDERKSTRPPGVAIQRKHDLRRCADARQVLAQLCLGRRVRQIANEQTDCHNSLSVSGPGLGK
jgi:hypothetical protein